ncbi:DUF6445 family protein [Pseudoduganella sp. LjRoot289]|uniref:DUF6445 family protein n=1 Tax=Pseudoduganella sp. LjRoot289 TaxID=3342314 RepID=UPI003ECFBDA5
MLINPAASVRVEHADGVPVLYIENFYADPDAVRAQALQARYDTSLALYPGRHAMLDQKTDPQLALVCDTLARAASAVGDRRYFGPDFFADFSIVTTRPQDLLAKQKHPHVDPTPVLGLIYLTPGSEEGTCFFRNEMLGKAVLRTEADFAAHQDFLERHGKDLAPSGYDCTGHPAWKKFYTIEPVYNRFVLYPGNVFHSIDIKQVDDQLNMERVRVTQRFVVQNSHSK